MWPMRERAIITKLNSPVTKPKTRAATAAADIVMVFLQAVEHHTGLHQLHLHFTSHFCS